MLQFDHLLSSALAFDPIHFIIHHGRGRAMKVYRLNNRIVMSGKAWEIRAKLKEYGRMYHYVKDWLSEKENRMILIDIKKDRMK